jgi:hypothetical protein
MKLSYFTLTAILAFSALPAFAQNKPKANPTPSLESHIAMHEKMAAAHQGAADCLKAGKPTEECREQFRSKCKEAGLGMECRMGMGKRKGAGPRW